MKEGKAAWLGIFAVYFIAFALSVWITPPLMILWLLWPIWCFCRFRTRWSWGPLFLALITALPIATLSGGSGSANGWQESLMAWFNLPSSQAQLGVLWIRKTIHFTAYGLIGLTMYAALKGIPRPSKAYWAALWVASHAAFDELRQHLTPGRSGRLEDFMTDMLGASVFLAAALWFERLKKS